MIGPDDDEGGTDRGETDMIVPSVSSCPNRSSVTR